MVWADAEDNISGMGTSSSKGQPLMVAVEVGAEDTSSDGY